MALAAGANDRAAIIYMAKGYETGIGIGTVRYGIQSTVQLVVLLEVCDGHWYWYSKVWYLVYNVACGLIGGV